jgi:hypothetical protein
MASTMTDEMSAHAARSTWPAASAAAFNRARRDHDERGGRIVLSQDERDPRRRYDRTSVQAASATVAFPHSVNKPLTTADTAGAAS